MIADRMQSSGGKVAEEEDGGFQLFGTSNYAFETEGGDATVAEDYWMRDNS